MNESRETSSRHFRINHYILAIAVIWTVLVGSFLSLYFYEEYKHTLLEVQGQARAVLDKDITLRRWVTGYGGVYVPATKETPPNPYLSHVPERDIVTPSGRLLTLINPAYMIRLLHEFGHKQSDIIGHLTSLNPLKPQNVPDSWEAEALRAFERGKTEVSSVETKDGKSYLRLMRPLITERGCLKCHAAQGYKEGDIRGGISVSMPFAPILSIERLSYYSTIIGYIILWVLGLVGIAVGGRRIGKHIRERDLSEEALRESNERFRNAFEHAAIGMALVAPDGCFLRVNRALCDLTGYSESELLAKTFQDITHPDDLDADLEFVRQMLAGEIQTYQMEKRYFHKDGHVVWILLSVSLVRDAEGNPVHFISQIQDITERKRAEDAVKASEERFRLLFDNAGDGILLADLEDKIFKMGNRKICEMLGYSQEEIQHLGVMDIHPEEDLPYVVDAFEKQARGEPIVASDIPVRRRDGSVFYADISSALITFGDGRYLMGRFRDVTRERELQKRVQAAQRMESVGTLAGGIAHDFNNVLTGILGYGELLRARIAGDPKALADLDEISRAAEWAATLTLQLLTFARRQVVEPVNLDLRDVVKDLMRFFAKVAGEHIEIKTFLGEYTPTVRVDRGQIQQVIMNLCLNARDAMPQGGQLLVETGGVTLEEGYIRDYPYMKEGRYAMVMVSDTGIGMDEATRERVFEPFFTTKTPDKGTGLGLSVVYGIVKQHNGYIHVYSEPGKGSTFKVYFPAIEAPADVRMPVKTEPIRGGSETILLAEDEEAIRSLAERILKDIGYTVLLASNGEEAVDLFRQHGEKIGLAVLDVVMPRMGGKEAFEVMRKENPGLKVLFMSGYSGNSIHEAFVIKPDTPFLGKPFAPTVLARKVRELLDG